jgi:hypothetical protein
MGIEIAIWKGEEVIFTYSFSVRDRSEVPEYFKKAIACFYENAPHLSLLDPEVFIKVDAPMNKDMPLYRSNS